MVWMVETQPRRREDWTDEEYVRDWLVRERDRGPVRNRQFGMVRAFVPRDEAEEFRYLDIGCGDGRLDEQMLARYSRATAVLLDGSPVMLESAKERLSAYPGRVETVHADLSAPGWERAVPRPVHVAVSTIAIHNLRDPRRIRALYAELYELLEDGGVFINLDYTRPAAAVIRDLSRWAGTDPDQGPASVSSGGGSPGTVEEQLVWLREAGFSPADCPWKEFQASLLVGLKGHVVVPSR
jgi:tRNA (cmo5U34)-methyltransferase